MPVDPRMFAPVNVLDIYERTGQLRDRQEQRDNRKRLADLLPGAMNGDKQAMQELAGVNPELFMRLDERQKAQASAELNDLASAVRWADTPEKWQQVQQYYTAQGHDVSQYPFEARESALVQLGKIGEYLKSAPQAEYKTLEPGGSLIDVSGGQPRVVIAPNDGSYQTGAPVQSGGGLPRVSDQQSYDAVPPGAQYMTPDGHVRVKGGQSGGGSTGGFPY